MRRDWQLLGVSAAFTLIGAMTILFPGQQGRLVWQTVFVAVCTAVFAFQIARRARERKSELVKNVSIAGGVPIPMRLGRALLPAAAFVALAPLAFANVPWAVRICGAVAGLGGAAAIVAVLAGATRQSLQFDPEGLRIAYRSWSCVVRWDDVAAVRLGEIYRNRFAAVDLRDDRAILDGPHRRRVEKMLRQNRRWYGCDVWIPAGAYGLDAVLFVKTIHRYVSDREARAELQQRAQLS